MGPARVDAGERPATDDALWAAFWVLYLVGAAVIVWAEIERRRSRREWVALADELERLRQEWRRQ